MSSRLELPPRLVDWSILVAVGFSLLTGLVSLVSGRPGDAVVFVLHGMGGLALVVLLFWKLRRVRHRVMNRAAWDRHTPLSVLLATIALAALGSGILWVFGGTLDIGPWGLLNLHIGLGLLVVPLVLLHLYRRAKTPNESDFEGRRTALSYLALVGFGALTWRFQRELTRLFDLGGARHRFTGSKPETGTGNDFPVTSWVADDPDPIDHETWRLRVGGDVERTFELDSKDIDSTVSGPLDSGTEQRALLDCTSGWYSEHDWRGLRVGDLLDAAGPTEKARWVSFRSVTGYRWSLPIEEARNALLATHTDGERLSHGHGFPVRLVAPGRRGFQWVKWVEAIEVTRQRDLSEWVAVFVSGFDTEES